VAAIKEMARGASEGEGGRGTGKVHVMAVAAPGSSVTPAGAFSCPRPRSAPLYAVNGIIAVTDQKEAQDCGALFSGWA
jgi:hypothetical protein